MDLQQEVTAQNVTEDILIEEKSAARKPLEVGTRHALSLLRDTEALLRRPTVATLAPILPGKLGENLSNASSMAEESLQTLAEIDTDTITDWELQPARIMVGLSFVGFGALMVVLLLLYLRTLHPQLSAIEQIHMYWYEYIWFVCFGVAGMFMLGRESMRPVEKQRKRRRKSY